MPCNRLRNKNFLLYIEVLKCIQLSSIIIWIIVELEVDMGIIQIYESTECVIIMRDQNARIGCDVSKDMRCNDMLIGNTF